jgi:Flp pilus assembly CpaE family ATPase
VKNVIAALGHVDWEAQFVSGLGHPMFGVRVQRRCVDGVDIRAAIQVTECQGVLVSDATPRVSQDLLADLLERDIQLIAITSNFDRWHDLGVEHCIELDPTNPLASLKKVAELIRGESQSTVLEPEPKGIHIAVAGFGGSCGRTTAVKELGWQFSKMGALTCIVEADTYGPSLDQELGLESIQSGLLEVCRSVERRNSSIQHHLGLLPEVSERLSLVAGLPRTSRWTDLRVSALRELWQKTRAHFDVVISDVGGVLEIDHSLMHETSIPRRHAAALTALESAQITIICARADSVGIARLVRGYLELHELFAKSDVHVLLWGITSQAQSKDVRSAVTRHTGLESIFETEYDFNTLRKALEQNTFVGKLDAKNSITKEFESIASPIFQNLAAKSRSQSATTRTRRNLLKRVA